MSEREKRIRFLKSLKIRDIVMNYPRYSIVDFKDCGLQDLTLVESLERLRRNTN